MFIPKKRPDVVISLDEGVIRETTTEERKPITVFDIEKTTPKTQAVSKGVEFVSYFTPAFVPLVTGDIAKSSEEIKRIRVREDLTSTQKEELIGKEKTKIGVSSSLLLGVGAFKAYKGLTTPRKVVIEKPRTKVLNKNFALEEFKIGDKKVFARITVETPGKVKTSTAIQDLFGGGEVKSIKKYGQIIVETPEGITKGTKKYVLDTKKVSKAPAKRMSLEETREFVRTAEFQPVIRKSLIEPKLLGMKTEGAITDIRALVKSTPLGKVSIKKVKRPSELYKEQKFRETYQLPSRKVPKTRTEFDVKERVDLDAKPTVDILQTRVKKLPQIIPERQVYLSETVAQEIKVGELVGKPSKESSTILEFIKPEESGIKVIPVEGGKKSSPEFLQKMWDKQVQLPAPKVKTPKPTTQITEVITKTPTIEAPLMVGGRGLKTIPYEGTGQYEVQEVQATSRGPIMQSQLVEPRSDIISDVKLDTQQKTDIKIITEPKIKTGTRTMVKIISDAKVDSKVDTKIDTKIKTKMKMKLITKQKMKTMMDIVTQIRPGEPRPTPPKIPVPKIKVPIITDTMKSKTVKEAEKVLDSFKVFVTKAGKDVELDQFGTLGEAKKALKGELKETLRAGGFVEKGGKKVKINLGFGFRPSKVTPGKVVQLKELRFGTRTETKEAQFFRKQKGGSKFF